MRHTWRVVAPAHAVTHKFLMHEILAFSALHKAYKLPEQRVEYYTMGIHHQDLAIRGVREKLQDVTPHEAAAIVATSTLLTLSVLASTGFEFSFPEIPSSQGAIDGILNIFSLMQGMGNVLALAQVHVMDSFLAPMFQDPREATPSQPMLQELNIQLPTLISFVEGTTYLPEDEREVYLGVIRHFEPGLRSAMPPRVDNRELRFLFFWPLCVGPQFLTYLRQRHSGAIAVIMYYATILFTAQSRYWFLQGWEKLMRECIKEIHQDWSPAVQWPASFIDHVPTYSLFSNLGQAFGKSHVPSANDPVYPTRAPVEVPLRYYPAPSVTPEQKTNKSPALSTYHAAPGLAADQETN
jgi:hypothetical protein